MSKTIRVLYKAPGERPEWRDVDATLETYQDLVGGYIEAVPWDDKHWLVVNEEGILRGFEINFFWTGAACPIVGPVFFAAETDEEFTSILDDGFIKEIEDYTRPYWEDEDEEFECGMTLGEIDDALRELRQ